MDTRVKPAYDAMCESSSRKRGDVTMLQNVTA